MQRAKQLEATNQDRLEYFANMSHELAGPGPITCFWLNTKQE